MAKNNFILFFLMLVGLILTTTPLGAEEARVSLASGKVVKVNCRRVEGQVYFPLRQMAEPLGIQYAWSAKSLTATLSLGKEKILVSVNHPQVLVKGKEVELKFSPKMINKHLFVPGEFLTGPLAELLDQEVAYQTSTVIKPADPTQKLLKNVRWYAYPSHTRLVFDLSQPLAYEIYNQEAGLLKVLIKGAALSLEMEERSEAEIDNDAVLTAYSAYPAEKGLLVACYLQTERAQYSHFFLKDPPRVVVDIIKNADSRPPRRSPEPEVLKPTATPAPPVVEKTEPKSQEPVPGSPGEFKVTERPLASLPPAPGALKTIVLDPGHGDFDSGAVGPTGLKEKEVVLDVALRLAQLLEKELGLKVIMTRKTDVFVPLRERTRIANRYQADLFFSIHANADKVKKGKGVETFFLDLEASDEEARTVAAFENGVINLEKNAAQEINVLATLLWDLTESAHQRESSQLAELVQNQLEKNLASPGRGVKTAHFYVLRGALMPAILTEIGFISHREEEKKLRNPEYRQQVAEALFKSIAEYKNIYEKRMGVAQKP